MDRYEEQKKRLKDLCETLPRGGKARLVRYVGISSAQLWNLLNKPNQWTSAEHEEKLWAFFEQGRGEHSLEESIDDESGAEDRQKGWEDMTQAERERKTEELVQRARALLTAKPKGKRAKKSQAHLFQTLNGATQMAEGTNLVAQGTEDYSGN